MAKDPSTGAITSRIKRVFNLPELGLFFITGQPTGTERFDSLSERHASILAMPYNTLTEAQNADFAMKSANIAESHVDVLVNTKTRKLEFYDRFTHVTSYCPFDSLNADIKTRIDLAVRHSAPGLNHR